MSPRELFDIWAPRDAVWSVWAKPSLFATIHAALQATAAKPELDLIDVKWAPRATGENALILELPGAASVRIGLALAQQGYRPVPLFNTTADEGAVVPVGDLIDALVSGASVLSGVGLVPEAPPAFLLDADRMRAVPAPRPGEYDNCWMVFPQDFPSATFLRSRGIERVTIISGRRNPATDLSHVLCRWQEAGIAILFDNPADGRGAEPITVRPPPLYRSLWHRFITLLRLRRNFAGGFGALVPEPHRGGYG
jgi:hypothetical protein